MKQLMCLVLLSCIGWQCNKKERIINVSFYHWKQQYKSNNVELHYLNNLKIKKMYIRFFDVSKNNDRQKTQILSPIHFRDIPPDGLTIVPTIYITNNTLKSFIIEEIPELVDLIWTTRLSIIAKYNILNVKGLQIDCDWSLSTRDKYFELLKQLKSKVGAEELSATIRLHQVKFYKKTGIPPVDRGTLMFYNMDDVTDEKTKNSILDLEVAKQYMVNFDKYTLPLDVALPMFSWGVVRRRGRVVQLINHLKKLDMANDVRFEIGEKVNTFQVLESHYFKGFYLYKDDVIRLEESKKSVILESAKLLNQHIRKNEELNVTFYHLDSAVLSNYKINDVKKWVKVFE